TRRSSDLEEERDGGMERAAGGQQLAELPHLQAADARLKRPHLPGQVPPPLLQSLADRLGVAIEHRDPEPVCKALEQRGRDLAREMWSLESRVGGLEMREFGELLTACRPLHPTVSLLLEIGRASC